jgi:hypothetical protein
MEHLYRKFILQLFYFQSFNSFNKMKLLKNLATLCVAATLYVGYFTSCQQAAPTPDAGSAVSIKPPTPVVNPLACETAKNPAEEIEWIKKMIAEAKEKNKQFLMVQYDYKNRKVYFFSRLSPAGRIISYCDGTTIAYDVSIAPSPNFEEVLANLSNPVVIADLK